MDFDTLFPDNREEGTTAIRQCQLVMLRMLKIFDYLCIKHNIKYFLTGGSLLGAIRHQGFIPWDDDLDVAMLRDEYEKFIQYAASELPYDIFFQTPQTDPHYPPYSNVEARLRDKYSSYNHIGSYKRKWHEGFQVDIFVYDRSYLPHNFFVITQNKLLKLLNNNLKRATILKVISKYIPLPLVYSSNFLQYYSELKSGTYIKPKECATLIRTKFENMEVWLPQGYDSYLRRQYGDYMQLPPVEKRVSNHDVVVDPFTPCDHTEILQWNQRTEMMRDRKVFK
jgi:lipopolysaccharide cholinephosphotransferase